LQRPYRRRGNYILLFLVSVFVILGFGAFTVDLGFRWMSQAQAQDVADAAAQAALVVLRQTGETGPAEAAAAAIVASNKVAGGTPEFVDITFGLWDDTVASPVMQTENSRPNAVNVTVARRRDDAVPYLLAKLWGYDTFDVVARATAATRSVQIVFVVDITGSWKEAGFASARESVLIGYDMLAGSSSALDEFGLTIFSNRYAWEYVPFSFIADDEIAADIRADLTLLNMASKGGFDVDHYDGVQCGPNPSSNRNDFSNPAGGCYPDMPREYSDESGTDHSTGMLQAQEMFEANASAATYRALIIITDGNPAYLDDSSGDKRDAANYVEERWVEYVGPVPRTKSQIRAASIDAAADLWDELAVNTWVVSLQADDSMLPSIPQGDGYYVRTSSNEELRGIIGQIISELPLALVE
jgi:Flp pilus assembly protein TadG